MTPRNYIRDGKMLFYNHMPGRMIKHLVDDNIWNSYFKFCFERNPWDKIISSYCERKVKEGLNQSLSEFIRCGETKKLFFSDFSFMYNFEGEMVVDFIGKYENLKEDLEFVCKKLGMPELVLTKAKFG